MEYYRFKSDPEKPYIAINIQLIECAGITFAFLLVGEGGNLVTATQEQLMLDVELTMAQALVEKPVALVRVQH